MIKIDPNDIVVFDDGFHYFWPSKQGGLASHHLRKIADHLDELDKDWQIGINQYFNVDTTT